MSRLLLVLGLLTLGMSHADAQKRTHRPWFSRSHPALPSPSPRSLGGTDDREAGGKEVKGDKVVKQALRYRGTRYRFGGTSKKGLDCSGLIARVYNDLKFKRLPHASSAMYRMGKPVSTNELRPGDLVFFKNTYRRGVSHVGVYAGRNRFVHARNRRFGVTITRLSEPYYQIHYAGARRLY